MKFHRRFWNYVAIFYRTLSSIEPGRRRAGRYIYISTRTIELPKKLEPYPGLVRKFYKKLVLNYLHYIH